MFYGNIDRKTILTILGVCVVFSLLLSGEFKDLIITLPGVIIAMTFHEFAHAWVADKLGDTTPRSQGRLNLNPMTHVDPVGLILLMFVHIGWGRPVQINPNNFTRNMSMETGEMLVSLAGPLMNFILAFIFMIVYCALESFKDVSSIVLLVISGIVAVNIGLGVFNLIPIPPLDGSKIFRRFLPYNVKEWLDNNMQIIYILFMVLWVTGLLLYIVKPVINFIFLKLYFVVATIFNIFI